MAQRLTEEEVHAACTEIAQQGERPTSLILLDRLGRGSLTTITKYLNSWNDSDQAKILGVESLPAIIELPPELTKDGENLIKKIWAIAKGIADEELDIQREALKQVEINNQAKVEEAFKFSEAQSLKNERLEDTLAVLKAQLDEKHSDYVQAVNQLNAAEKVNVGLSKDNEQLQHEMSDLKGIVLKLEESNKAATQDKQALQQQHDTALKQKDTENRSLEMQIHKLQSELNSMINANDQYKVDIKETTAELSNRIIEFEKLTVRFDSATSELKTVKADFKTANKIASDAEKLVSNLEGQLKAYKSTGEERK
jgi:chromosome segregation ATPase